MLAKAEIFQDARPLRVGDIARLNSGGPPSLIVDADDEGSVTLSWRDDAGSILECTLPRACAHSVAPYHT